jgi:hypothetical protein
MANPMAQSDPTKVVGRRVLAVVLDWIIVLIPFLLLFTASLEYLDTGELTINGEPVTGEEYCDAYLDNVNGICIDFEDIDDRVYYSDDSFLGAYGFYTLATFLLLVVLQGFTGWTPGKLITGIRVVAEDGSKPGVLKALVRWLLWIVDGFPYFIPGLTGFIVALSTPGHRRVGDLAAKTFVVKRAAAGTPIDIRASGQLLVGEQPTTGMPPAWGPSPSGAVAGDPSQAGWATPAPPAPTTPVAPAPSTEGPQWDEARGTYIQWDPAQGTWMQWDEGFKAWTPIPGQ